MFNIRKSFLGTLLLTSGLLATTEAEVTCIEKTVHAISNPSFETGDLTDWTSLVATGAPSRGTVIADDSVDGEYHFTIPATPIYTYLKQTLTDLDTSKSYDLAVDYKIYAAGPVNFGQWCYLAWAQDGWSSFIESRSRVYPSYTEAEWAQMSVKWQPTSSTHDLYLVFACTSTGLTIDLDNLQLPIRTESVCSTSTPSLPETTISSTLATSAFPSSTPKAVTSSSVIISQVSTSPPAHESVAPSQSSLAQSSSAIMASAPSSIAVTVTHSVHESSLVASVPLSSSVAVTHSVSIPTSASASPPTHPSSISSSIQMSSSTSPSGLPSQPIHTHTTVHSSIVPHHSGSHYPAAPSQPSQTLPYDSIPPFGVVTSATIHPGVPTSAATVPLTTSTVLTTRTSTITACPSTIPHCPAASRTTSVITETVVASTTVCPATQTVQPIEATQTTSSFFSTRTSTVTSCPNHQLYCALPHRSTQIVTETMLVSTTVYLVAVPTSDRRPVFVDNSAVFRPPPQATQIDSAFTGSHDNAGGEEWMDGFASLPAGPADVTRTQIVFQTIFVTQTAFATACPPAVTGSSSAHPQPRSTHVRPVYF